MKFRLIWVFAVVWFSNIPAFSDQSPTVKELLDKFAQTQEAFDSFTAKTEVSVQLSHRPVSPQASNINRKRIHEIDFRYDRSNRRTKHCEFLSGDVLPTNQKVSRDTPMYRSGLFVDQGLNISYGTTDPISDAGRVTLSNMPVSDPDQKTLQAFSRAFTGHEAFGYIYGHDERVDEILRDADRIRVRDRKQNVGGTDCYIIEASTQQGNYTLWIDPEHGYNLARAKLLIEEGDTLYETTANKGDKYYTLLDNVKFEQVEGVWVPVEADVLYQWKVVGKYTSQETIHFKAVEYRLNPDHEALGSFKPDDIQNGARVTLIQNNRDISNTYYWQDGKVVDEQEKVVVDRRSVQ
jgi:hypothetical protein